MSYDNIEHIEYNKTEYINTYKIDSLWFDLQIIHLKYLLLRESKVYGDLDSFNNLIYEKSNKTINKLFNQLDNKQKSQLFSLRLDKESCQFLTTIKFVSKQQPKQLNSIQKLNNHSRLDIFKILVITLFIIVCVIVPLIGAVVLIHLLVGRDGLK